MAAAARARNPELAGMTRRQKVDRIEQNLRETQATLDRKLAQLGPDTSSINRAVLQKAKAKVEEALRKMDGLPSGDALNQLKEGSSNLSEISSTLDQAMASSREVARLLTLQDSANVSVLIGQLLRSATGKALSDEPLSRGEIHNFSSQIDAILTGPLKGKTGNPIYQGLTVLKEGLDSANPPSGKDFWDALVGLNSLCAQANADIVKLQAQTV
jgi:hypothetical protein